MAGEPIEAIRAVNRRVMELFAAGDAAGVAACYTETAQFLPPNAEVLRGRAAIAAAIQGLREMGIRAITLDTFEVEAIGGGAWEVGRYTLGLADGTVADRGKYVVIWKQEGGTWRLHRDIFNSSLPIT
jgi:uncharacterized protein (TIGR02246 family)